MKAANTPFDFGPLQKLLQDEAVTEVMVNSYDRIFFEQSGKLEQADVKFVDQRQLDELIQQILFKFGARQDQSSLSFDGSVANGFRYNITLPPMSRPSASLTIRKFRPHTFSLAELERQGVLSLKAAQFLEAAMKAKLSIVVAGGTGTGKTTLINTLALAIPENERVVTIEEVPELRLALKNVVTLLTVEHPVSVTARDCVVNALRMRPDRIIVGECRRDETFEMLQAMNTGHSGSMTSVHANSAVEALTRIESLVGYSKIQLPIKEIRAQIAQAIDLIVQLRREPDGRRVVSEIIELTGMNADTITRAPIFSRDKTGPLLSNGYVPTVVERFRAAGIKWPNNFF